jgi:chromate transport protein ChrA
MPDYEPISRRPIAMAFRRTAEGATRLCLRWRIHPDAISYLSILAALAAAIFFWKSGQTPWLLIVALLFCYLRLLTALLSAASMDPIHDNFGCARNKITYSVRIHSVL